MRADRILPVPRSRSLLLPSPIFCLYAGQSQPVQAPTPSADIQNSGYSAASAPAPAQEAATNSGNTQTAASSQLQQLQQQQSNTPIAKASYSSLYAIAPKAADSAYSGAAAAQAPTAEASYGPNQALSPQSSYTSNTNTDSVIAGLCATHHSQLRSAELASC